jgi:HSP20 family protein
MMERWRPRTLSLPRAFREMEEEMERMMEEPFRTWPVRLYWRRAPGERLAWAPSMDMYEKEDSYILRFDLSGVKPEEVDISMSGDTLTVKGDRNPPEGIKEEEWQASEMCYGPFSRSITFPMGVNADKIEANFDNGILEIHLPKTEEVKPKQIKIQAKQLKGGKS